MDDGILTVLVILVTTVFLLAFEVFRIDLVAVLCMLALAWTGVLTPVEALSGFSSNAVIAMMAVMIMGGAIAKTGVMNIFAGVPRGTVAQLDLNNVCFRRIRHIGHSGLTTEDMRTALGLVESGALSPNRLVSAIGSIEAAKDGWQAVADATFPGKVVIYLHLKDLPLTPIADVKKKLPSVHAKLRDGRVWTREAEEELLRVMLA